MQAFRHILAQRHLAVLICAAAMLLKLLVPTGYMIASDHERIALTLCSGMVAQPEAMVMPGMDQPMAMAQGTMRDKGKSTDHGKSEMPCAFAGLTAQVLGAVDVVLLAVALAVVAIMALRSTPRVAPRAAPYLRPPLRGPPPSA